MTGDIILLTMQMAVKMQFEITNQIEKLTKIKMLQRLAGEEEPYMIYLQLPSAMNEMEETKNG